MRKYIIIILLFIAVTSVAQNKQILYGFDKIPQTLLLNPGGETTYKKHIGIPFLSGISASANISTITVAEVFRNDKVSFFEGTDFNVRFRNAINKLDGNDYAYINSQIEILSGGYKINDKDYLSAGFYTEAEAFIASPKDVFTLMDKGNSAYLNKAFSISQVSVKADVIGVLHAGISRRFNNRFTAGARLKIYSGSVNINSTENVGTFTTQQGTTGIYEHILKGVDAEINSSGIYNEKNEVAITVGNAFGGTFFGGNFGVGFDVGFTYYANEQLQFTASVLDVGYIKYSKDTRNAKIKGDYSFSGVQFAYDNSNKDYWTELKEDFKAKVPNEENKNSYSVSRPIKINGSVRYGFGKSRNLANCHDTSYKDFYDNAVGGQLFTVFRPNGLKYAFTGFYERKFSKYFNTKFTYTIDDFSQTNIGVGASLNVWKLNVYGMVDNIFAITDVANAHRTSFQLGINLIYN